MVQLTPADSFFRGHFWVQDDAGVVCLGPARCRGGAEPMPAALTVARLDWRPGEVLTLEGESGTWTLHAITALAPDGRLPVPPGPGLTVDAVVAGELAAVLAPGLEGAGLTARWQRLPVARALSREGQAGGQVES